ncbi:MAG: FGGY family carbohydrate kinase [Sphingobacteriaceae bacterium]
MEKVFILAIDQGTSSTKTLIFNTQGEVVAKATETLKTNYLEGGLVEQDPDDIYDNVLRSVKACLSNFTAQGGDVNQISSCGISNQRETFVVWDETGKALSPAVVWQCKRSIAICEELNTKPGMAEKVKNKTGLIIDPYFSGTKLMWLNQHQEAVSRKIKEGKAFFGTVDTWLLYKLSGGTTYLTDYSNASRTLLFNLETLQWDEELIGLLGLSGIQLPEPKPSAYAFGNSTFEGLFTSPLAITAMIGDSHAAAFGEGCLSPGTAKATLGTGCSILMNTGSTPKSSSTGMMSTICWSTEERVDYALEGVIVSCGSTIEWLKNEIGLFSDSRDTEQMAAAVTDNNGVYIVPAFSGLGAPYWDMNCKAAIEGLSFESNKNHIARAALEVIPFQIKDILEAMQTDTGLSIHELMINGGISSNSFVMDFLADLLDARIIKSSIPDISALGAAYLSGLGAGIYQNLEELKQLFGSRTTVRPEKHFQAEQYYQEWKQVILKKLRTE